MHALSSHRCWCIMHDIKVIYIVLRVNSRSADGIHYARVTTHKVGWHEVNTYMRETRHSIEHAEKYIRWLSSWSCDVFSSVKVYSE